MRTRQTHSKYFRAAALVCAALLCVNASGARVKDTRELGKRIDRLVAESGAETVAVAFRDLQTGRELFVNERVSFHAASTMKVPVMFEIYREARAGILRLDESVPVKNEFKSIADGSDFSVSPEDDSERTLYKKSAAPRPCASLCA